MAHLKPTTTPDGRELTAIYVGRKLIATLHFSAKNGPAAEEAAEVVQTLWEESNDE